MDASSIITQVSRDEEQLNSYPPENGKYHIKIWIKIIQVCVQSHDVCDFGSLLVYCGLVGC